MSDHSEEPTDEVETLLKSERRRQGRERAGTLVMVAGLIAAGVTLALSEASAGSKDGLSYAWWASTILILVGAGVTIRWQRGRATRRLESLIGRRDRLQRARTNRIYATSVSGWGMVAASLPALWRIAHAQAESYDRGFVTGAALAPLLVVMGVAGWNGLAGLNRRWLEDEVTRDIRRRALSLGFMVLMLAITMLFTVGLWFPSWATMVFPAALMLSASVAGLRFVWLDQQAEGGVDG